MNSLRFLLCALVVLTFAFAPASISQVSSSPTHFIDSTASLNIPDDFAAWTAIWFDFNNDGDEDLFTSSYGHPHLFKNNGDGTFTDVVNNCGFHNADGDYDATDFKAAVGDFDNDGYLDILTSDPGRISPPANRICLYKNNKDGTFTDIAAQPGSGIYVSSGVAVSWADFDNDGLLDFFSGSSATGYWPPATYLFHNNGDGSFTDITSPAGIAKTWSSGSCAWADYDNDNKQDLYVVSVYGLRDYSSILYHNRGDGTMEMATDSSGAFGPATSASGSSWADYNNDGYLDLFIATGWNYPNYVYRNNGDGTFTDVTESSGLWLNSSCNNGIWADYDNDGHIDLFIYGWTNGVGTNILYRNNGDGTFTDVTEQVFGSAFNQQIRAATWGDYNNDGFLDLFIGTGPTDSKLFQNSGNSNNWIAFKLQGTKSNRAAIGARVEVYSGDLFQIRTVKGGGESHDSEQDSLRVGFGLGSHNVIDKVIIKWPSGIIQNLNNIATNQILTVIEGNKPPSAQNQTVATNENTPMGVELAATDPDGDSLTFSILTSPQHGILTGNPPLLTYTPAINYFGPDEFTFKANDGKADSNVATVSIIVRRVFSFYGFDSPVDNQPIVNNAKAGSTIPVKWRITDLDGTPVSDPASFVSLKSYVVNCANFEGAPVNSVDEFAAGSSGLQYLGDGRWQFNWKTATTYKGQCRTMILTLDDHSEHTAKFSFK